jgi:hypothetical protein
MQVDVIVIHPNQIRDLRVIVDRFGIYAERKALQRIGIASTVYRGDEWWHCGASDQWPNETSRQFNTILDD